MTKMLPKSSVYYLAISAILAGWLNLITVSKSWSADLDLTSATIEELNKAFADGSLTSEKLLQAYLKRIEAYDKTGPQINAIITLNPKAMETAKALDAERKVTGPRSPLHGIPVVLKDNFDTYDLPTTAGSQLLKGSIPPDDAFVVKKLRDAGAIILAKLNMSEWAGSGGSVGGATDPEVLKAGRTPNGFSSMGLQTRNPHDLSRGPSGSSGGTGAAIAAGFAQIGLGTDTGGSVRGPASANGIAGLKPTLGLMSRDGIVPLALSYDTGGPMARSVYDVAAALGAMTGVDAADAATQTSFGNYHTDYTQFLIKGSLKGARIGVARQVLGRDEGTDKVIEGAIATLKKLGAEVVDVDYPRYLTSSRQAVYTDLVSSEFKAQITQYLRTLKPGFPTSFDEIVELSNDPQTRFLSPEKAYALKYTASLARDLDHPYYLAIKNHMLPAVKAGIDAMFTKYRIDAIVYPTSPRPASPIVREIPSSAPAGGSWSGSATSFANFTGYPDLIVPAGMTDEGLPVTISFFGPAYSEPKLLSYGYDFEQATNAVRLPKNTPSLSSDEIKY